MNRWQYEPKIFGSLMESRKPNLHFSNDVERAGGAALNAAGKGLALAAVFIGKGKGEAEVAPLNSGGRLGIASTRAQNAAMADSLESRGFTVTGGGGRLPEEYIPGPGGGTKGSNYVNVTAERDWQVVRVQTVDTRGDGVKPTAREANAAARIRSQQQPGDHTVLIPKKDQ